MYDFKSRVRYSETDERNEMTVTAMVNYLQDCSTFHSADVGLTVDALTEKKRAWLLSYWDIYVDRLPHLGEEIIIGTSPHGFRGVLAGRNFWMKDSAGEFLLRADSRWFLYDTENQRPTKITEDMLLPFGAMQDVLGLPLSSRKIEVPAALTALPPIVVQKHHIDSNHHVNNAQYIAMALEVLQEHFPEESERWKGGRIRAEYQKAAVLKDQMIPCIGKTEQGAVVSLQSEEGEVYANVAIG